MGNYWYWIKINSPRLIRRRTNIQAHKTWFSATWNAQNSFSPKMLDTRPPIRPFNCLQYHSSAPNKLYSAVRHSHNPLTIMLLFRSARSFARRWRLRCWSPRPYETFFNHDHLRHRHHHQRIRHGPFCRLPLLESPSSWYFNLHRSEPESPP